VLITVKLRRKVKIEVRDMKLLRSGDCRTRRHKITNEILEKANVVQNLFGHAKGCIQRVYREKY
jgi:hypothetical protein